MIWIFWICWLCPVWYNMIAPNWYLNFIAIDFNWSIWLWISSSKKPPAWNFANYYWHVWSITASSSYNATFFFFFCVCISYIFSFLELKQYVENVAFYSLFNIKMSTPKFTSFDKLFVCFFLFFNPWLIVKRRKKIIYMLPTRKNWHQSWGITHTVNEEMESDITYKQKQENWDTNILIKKER